MHNELRREARFDHFGHVMCDGLCPVGGVIDNVSQSGCRVHFDVPVTVSFESDYEIHARLSRFPTDELVLIGHPAWVRTDNGATAIGFSILRSPDTVRWESFVAQVCQEQQEIDDDGLPQENDRCLFV